jgi:two-component system nitrogen regulation response regulator GlnG/two-component system response regulator HydG
MAEETTPERIALFASSDAQFKEKIRHVLEHNRYRPLEVSSARNLFSAIHHKPIDIVFVDLEDVPNEELNFVNYTRMRLPSAEIITVAPVQLLETAKNSLKSGASFYLIKPIDIDNLHSIIEKAARRLEEKKETVQLRRRLITDLMSGNPAMERILTLVDKIAPTTSNVLIGGESGTGKEFVARIIHTLSGRDQGKFIATNCGAIPLNLFESELFGHRKGAFTGADRDKPGLIEEAHQGTLFLDEVGELPAAAQVKLLRFLQEKAFRRVGENALRSVDVRIIAATNKDIKKLVRDGEFREDLYYRLCIFYVHLPPLRYRKETIPKLVSVFVHRFNQTHGKKITSISKPAEVVLANYDYPGNVRELENIIEHAGVLAEDGTITERDLPDIMFTSRPQIAAPSYETPAMDTASIPTLREVEKQHIEYTLNLLDFNYKKTAEKLGISRSTLWRKIKEHKITPPSSAPTSSSHTSGD